VPLIAAQGDFAEILQARIVGIGVIGNAGQRDLGIGRPGEKQELVDLVAGDIGQDAAIGVPVEEPVRPRVPVQPVRPDPQGLDHTCRWRPQPPVQRRG
jgi:hypothetical protein